MCFRVDLTGKRFGKLTVIEWVGRKNGATWWKCRCDCGREKITRHGTLTSGNITQCGNCRPSDHLENMVFGRLTVIEKAPKHKNRVNWLCKCECGNYVTVRADHLLDGRTKTCGCYSKEIGERTKTHGMSKTTLYKVWRSMLGRCFYEKSENYKYYGGRGITVCDEWRNSFERFYEWAMDNGYSKGLTIDRIDNNGNYQATNCKWATVKEQENNKRNNHILEFEGQRLTIAQWSEKLGVKMHTLNKRINYCKWPVEKALKTPVKKRKGI